MNMRFPIILVAISAIAAGTLGACSSDNGSSATCGNNKVESGELCDGTDLGSFATCTAATMGAKPMGGPPTCNPDCKSVNAMACMGAAGAAGNMGAGGAPMMMVGMGGAPQGSGGAAS